MTTLPLMPKATAVWLVDNTGLSFEQIGDFCGLHPLEVQGIADGDVAQGIKGMDPVAMGQLERSVLERCEKDPDARLVLKKSAVQLPKQKSKGPRYTPVSRRQDRPDAINWLIRNHPELSVPQICALVGTTKSTVDAIKERTHWNAANLRLVDPVSLGLCSQIDLDAAVQKAAAKRPQTAASTAPSLLPTSETVGGAPEAEPEAEEEQRRNIDIHNPDKLFNLPNND